MDMIPGILCLVKDAGLHMKDVYSCLVKKFSKLSSVMLVGLISIMLQGCVVAAVGAGVGAVKYANAKKKEADVSCKNSYNNYLERMDDMGKKPMTLHDYCGT
jgi:hypothetical protein